MYKYDDNVLSSDSSSSTFTLIGNYLLLDFFSIEYHIPLIRRTSRTKRKIQIYYPVRALPIGILEYMLGDTTVNYLEMDNLELLSLRHLYLRRYRGPPDLYDSIAEAGVVVQNICNFSSPCQLHRIVHSSQVDISIEIY